MLKRSAHTMQKILGSDYKARCRRSSSCEWIKIEVIEGAVEVDTQDQSRSEIDKKRNVDSKTVLVRSTADNQSIDIGWSIQVQEDVDGVATWIDTWTVKQVSNRNAGFIHVKVEKPRSKGIGRPRE